MKQKSIQMVLLFDFYGDMLTDTQREFFDLYYNEDLSLSEIAENNGITRQGVRDAILRAETAITEMEDRLGLFRRYGAIEQGLGAIIAAAEEILRINNSNFMNAVIEERADEIVEQARRMIIGPTEQERETRTLGIEPFVDDDEDDDFEEDIPSLI